RGSCGCARPRSAGGAPALRRPRAGGGGGGPGARLVGQRRLFVGLRALPAAVRGRGRLRRGRGHPGHRAGWAGPVGRAGETGAAVSARHFLSSDDLTPAEQAELVRCAAERKRDRGRHPRTLEGRSVALIFEKPSTRTRISFETAVRELGAHPVVLRGDELQLGRGETLEDTA